MVLSQFFGCEVTWMRMALQARSKVNLPGAVLVVFVLFCFGLVFPFLMAEECTEK